MTFVNSSILRCSAFLSALLMLSTSAWSSGFYVGLGAGPETADFNNNATVVKPGSFNVRNNGHLSGTGAFGSLFGGYFWTIKSYFLAAEANVNISNVLSKGSNSEAIHNTYSKADYRMKRTCGLSLLPGYLFSSTTLFFARLGYVNSNYNLSTTDASLASVSKNLNGFRFGLGVSEKLSKMFSMRMEYSQAYYQSTSGTVVDVPADVTKTQKVSPTTGQVEFALIYDV